MSTFAAYDLDRRIEYVTCVLMSALRGEKHYRQAGGSYQADVCAWQAARWQRVLDRYMSDRAERDFGY